MFNWNDDEHVASLPTAATKTSATQKSDQAYDEDPLNLTDQGKASYLPQHEVGDRCEEAAATNTLEARSDTKESGENKADAPSDQPDQQNDLPQPAVSTGARRRDPHYNRRGSCSNSNPPSDRGSRRHRRQQHPQYLSNRKCTLIPSRVTGLLIGLNGKNIIELENEANVVLQVGHTDGNETDLTIYGTDESIAIAERRIQNIAHKANAPTQEQAAANHVGIDFLTTNNDGVATIDWESLSRYFEAQANARNSSLIPTRRDLYHEDPAVTAMLPGDVASWRRDNFNMQVRRNSMHAANLRPIPNPVQNFEQAFLGYPIFLNDIYHSGVARPSPIQCQALPILLRGDDLICTAQSGTGKSLAIIFSAILHAAHQPTPKPERKNPIILFLAPNKRFVRQLIKDLHRYQYEDVRSIATYRGDDRNDQSNITNGCFDLLVCTPSRLYDLVMAKTVQMINFTYIALFEADIILDKDKDNNFIRHSFMDLRHDKQVVLTGASWSVPMCIFALSFMKDPIQIKFGSIRDPLSNSVTQRIEFVDEEEKQNVLMNFLRSMRNTEKIIVFCHNKAKAMEICGILAAQGFASRILHDDTIPTERDAALQELTHGTINVLLATDRASRSINMQLLTHIVNYDCPGHIQEYVQRITRTGRSGRSSIALTCMTRSDWSQAPDLVLVLQEAQQIVPPELQEIARRFETMNLAERDSRVRREGNRPDRTDAARRHPQ